jgi:hypothetical protein
MVGKPDVTHGETTPSDFTFNILSKRVDHSCWWRQDSSSC